MTELKCDAVVCQNVRRLVELLEVVSVASAAGWRPLGVG